MSKSLEEVIGKEMADDFKLRYAALETLSKEAGIDPDFFVARMAEESQMPYEKLAADYTQDEMYKAVEAEFGKEAADHFVEVIEKTENMKSMIKKAEKDMGLPEREVKTAEILERTEDTAEDANKTILKLAHAGFNKDEIQHLMKYWV